MKFIAIYLPQFHPIPENDEWYGKGFTEWTNVALAKPLFPGHYQPRVPADLGFYDLRMDSVMEDQIKLAKKYNIYGFSFYHYWFGNGKELLEGPVNRFLSNKNLDFPFMLHWANGSWSKKLWKYKSKGDQLLIKQEYPGKEDAINHFYRLLPFFKDPRYIKIDNKLLFTIDLPLNSPEIFNIIDIWRELAVKEGLPGFYFIAHVALNKEMTALETNGVDYLLNNIYKNKFDYLIDSQYKRVMYKSFISKSIFIFRKKVGLPNIYSYKKSTKNIFREFDYNEKVFPEIFPRFDHSPRSKGKELIFVDDSPQLFKKYLTEAVNYIKNKPVEKQVVFIRAWNEWGEGNYLEPDLDFGLEYLKAIKDVLENDFADCCAWNVYW